MLKTKNIPKKYLHLALIPAGLILVITSVFAYKLPSLLGKTKAIAPTVETSPATIVGSNIQLNGSILSSDSPVTSAGFQITDDPSFATFYPYYTTTLLNSFGYEGTGDGQLGYTPQGVTLDSSGNIYVADTGNNRIQKFNSSGVYQSKFGSFGTGNGQFRNPRGIAVDSSGNIYVADTTNNRIQKFNSSGVYQSKFGSTGTGNGQFSSPRGVAVDSSGNIYVSEYTNNRVQIFNSAGVYQRKFTSSNNPTGLALDSSGNIYVSNMNTEVIKYSSLGVQLAVYNNANFGTQGCGGNNYTSVAVESSGNIYAAIAGCKISKIDSAGNLLRYFVADEYDGVYFDGPNAIAVDSNQNIYAVGGYSANDPHAFVFSGTVPVGGINTTRWGGQYCDTTYYYKAFATNSSGTTYGEALSFNFPCMEVSTLAATTNSTTTATLNGNISNNLFGDESARGFEWGTDTSYGNDLADAGLPPFYEGVFSLALTVPSCGVTYHYRAYAENNSYSGSRYYGSDQTFNIPCMVIESYDVQPDGGATSSSISLEGWIYSSISDVTARGFQWGTTTGYGNTIYDTGTPPFALGNYTIGTSVFDCNTTYHMRAYATNTQGTYYGDDYEFNWPCMEMINVGSDTITDTSANLKASVNNSYGDIAAKGFEYGLDTSYGQTISDTTTPPLSAGEYNLTASSLTCNTTYHFRPYGTNSHGTYYGGDDTFTTLGCTTVNTLPASGVGATSALLNGNVTETLSAIIGQGFQLGTSTSYGTNIAYTPSASTLGYQSQFGSSGSGDGQFIDPYGIAINTSGGIYVVDKINSRVQKFDNTGNYIGQFGSSGSGDGQFNGPYGVAIDSGGNIYVTDSNNNRVQKFDSNGIYLGQFGSSGSGNGQFNGPAGVAIDASGSIYVVDRMNDRVQKFDNNGNYLSQFGSNGSGDGQFNGPYGVAIDTNGNIFVADFNNERIQKFDNNGNYLSQFGSNGSGDGQFNGPYGVTLGAFGNIYVADSDNSRVQKFDSNGNYLSQFGNYGTGNGQFDFVTNLAIYNNSIYAIDTYNYRVQVFGPVPVYSTGPYSNQAPGLSCGTSYHYRAYVTNAGGTYYGADQAFNTQGCPYVPSSTTPTAKVNPNPVPAVDLQVFAAIGRSITPKSSPGGILGYIYRFLQALPHNAVIALPYLLIILLLVVALAYSVQALRDSILIGAYRKQAKHKQNALDAEYNLYGIILAGGGEAIKNIKKSLKDVLKAGLINKFELTAISASMVGIAKQMQVSEWAGYNHNAGITYKHHTSNTGKIIRGFISPLMWAPVLILGLVLIGLDLILTRLSIATIGSYDIKIQIALFAFCTLVVALVWLMVVRNRIVLENASDELSAVIMLMQANGAIVASVAEKSQMEMDEINSIARKIAHKGEAKELIKNIKELSNLLAGYGALELLNRQAIKPATSAQIKAELKDIIESNKRAISAKKLTISKTFPANLSIGLSAELIAVILKTNLENALELAETNGRITVELVQSARKINLNITSSGKALSRRMLHALEGPINNPRKLDAVGAGLYLNQIIVEAVGGKFSVVSDSKTGTLVKAQIPRNNPDVNNFKPNTELDNPELDMFKGKVKPA